MRLISPTVVSRSKTNPTSKLKPAILTNNWHSTSTKTSKGRVSERQRDVCRTAEKKLASSKAIPIHGFSQAVILIRQDDKTSISHPDTKARTCVLNGDREGEGCINNPLHIYLFLYECTQIATF